MSDLLERDRRMAAVAESDVDSRKRSRANTDAGLIGRFVRSRDEQAFEELERRYGPLVRGVCARALDRLEDREDVYQATFLTLFLRARTIRRRNSVACWLYGVAFRIATRLRRKRKQEQTELAFDPPADPQEVWVQIDRNHLSEVLDAEMQALPTRDRLPLAMHYLMGLSHQEIGQSLGISASAVDGRLKRARQRLRTRLLSRGVGLASAFAYFGTCLRQADAAAAAQAGAGEETLYSLFDGDAGASSISSEAQGLFAEEASMIAVGWGKGAFVLGGAALACCGLIGVFWGGAAGSGVAQAQYGGGGGFNGFRNVEPGPDFGPVVTVRLAGEQPAPQTGDAKFFSPLAELPATLAALSNVADVGFQDQPLAEVLDVLEHQVGFEFQVDLAGLEEAGTTPDSPVSVQSKSMTTADTLDAILSPLNLTYVAKERYILITSKDRASELLETRMYAIADHPLLRNANGNALMNAVVGHIEPNSWSITGGGSGSASLLPGVLIVTNDQRTLNQVEEFLAQYGRLLENFQPAENPAAGMMGMGFGMGSGLGDPYGGMPGGSGMTGQPSGAGGASPFGESSDELGSEPGEGGGEGFGPSGGLAPGLEGGSGAGIPAPEITPTSDDPSAGGAVYPDGRGGGSALFGSGGSR